MTFAVNVTAQPDELNGGSVWDTFSPLSRLLAIATVNNKAAFEGEEDGSGARKVRASVTFMTEMPRQMEVAAHSDMHSGCVPLKASTAAAAVTSLLS